MPVSNSVVALFSPPPTDELIIHLIIHVMHRPSPPPLPGLPSKALVKVAAVPKTPVPATR